MRHTGHLLLGTSRNIFVNIRHCIKPKYLSCLWYRNVTVPKCSVPKCLSTEMSLVPKCPCTEMSQGPKCPRTEMSQGPKCPRTEMSHLLFGTEMSQVPKCPRTEMSPVPKCLLLKCRYRNVPGRNVWYRN